MSDEFVAASAAGMETADPSSLRASPGRRRRWLAPLIVTSVVILFYLPGLRWGLPGTVSWSQDTIAGVRTLGAFDQWPKEWPGRYPPLQYLILHVAYELPLQHWDATGQREVDSATGHISLAQPHVPKIGLLILIARIVTVTMAAACGLGIWAAARTFGADDLASGLATVAFMTGAAFCYFAHLGNVDVPSICWFAWSLYAYGRLRNTGAMRFALLLGLFGTLAISTKDAVAGMYPGMALVLIAAETSRRMTTQPLIRSLFGAVFQIKWLVGLTLFIVPYLALYGAFGDWEGYWARMTYWLDPPLESLHANQLRYGGQFELLAAGVGYAAGAVGWPMLVALLMACGYALVRRRRVALALLVPAAVYYLFVICKIEFVYSRFLFAPLLLMSILLGLMLADLLRRVEWSPVYRYGPALIVFLPTFGYAWAVDAEMMTDSRYRA
ncbi:MAG: glycosyltransferase family 39 protein, partial [Planctomycetes bacterium]|nr:glycosyltransferase family 39 protein [Planctomycetota bacterium]